MAREENADPGPWERAGNDSDPEVREPGRLDAPPRPVARVHYRMREEMAPVASPGRGPEARRGDRRALKIAVALSSVFLVVEAVGGVLSGSLALLADAGHMLTDVFALGLALFAVWLADKPAPPHRTFGYYRAETLAALANGVLLVVIAGWILFEAWERWLDPATIDTRLMALVAFGGLAVNAVVFTVLHRRGSESLNLRAATLHVIGDMLGSVGALAAALFIALTGNVRVDAFVSVLIAALIIVAAIRLLRETLHVLMLGAPQGVDVRDVEARLATVPGVAQADDVHVWTVTSGFNVLTAHLVLETGADPVKVIQRAKDLARREFPVTHTTFEVEEEPCPPDMDCGPGDVDAAGRLHGHGHAHGHHGHEH